MKKNLQKATSVLLAAALLNTLPINVLAEDVREEYTVSLVQDSRVKYSGVSGSEFVIKSGAYRSIYAKTAADSKDEYYIDSVSIAPEGAADVTYNANTGEIFIENVTGDFTITPELGEVTFPADISVDWEFVEDGVYSEENPAATVKFTAVVTDNTGAPVPYTTIYYKSDVKEKSFTNAIRTDANGVATIKHAYGLNEGEDEAAFKALFSTDSRFSEDSVSAESKLNVVLQKKSDLELYTYQVRASRPDKNDGGVIGVDPRYEYFTGVLHQAAITTDSGEWVIPEGGNIDGLAPGQYALRWAERVEGDTIYLHSDYDYFTIDRAIWTVTAEETEGVTFKSEALYAAPGGEVFYYVDVEDSYEITDVSVDKPNYIGDIVYSAEGGYIYIDGITGSVKLNVTAEKAEQAAPAAAPTVKKLAKVATLGGSVSTLAAESESQSVEIVDVYQDINATDEGTQIAFRIRTSGTPTSSNTTLYYKQNTTTKYSTAATRNFTDNGDGTATIWFSLGTSSSARTYDVYATYNGEETEHITLNIAKKPSLSARTDFVTTPEKGDRANGTITVTKSEYENSHFIYYKQGQDNNPLYSESNVITGLEYGTWYVFVAPEFEKVNDTTYNVSVRSSSASVSVGREEATVDSYTVTFIKADGTKLENQYDEGTKASAIKVPANTASDGTYKYSWPAVSDVIEDVTYTEIQSPLTETKVEILDITRNSDVSQITINIKVTDNDGAGVTDTSSSNYVLHYNGDSKTVAVNNGVINASLSTNSALKTDGTSNVIYLEYKGNDEYAPSVSAEKTISILKPEAPVLEATSDINGRGVATITITNDPDIDTFVYYKASGKESTVNGHVIENVVGVPEEGNSPIYYVYVPAGEYNGPSDYNFVTASSRTSITVENTVINDFSLTLYGGYIDSLESGTQQAYYEEATIVTIEAPETSDGKYFAGWFKNDVLQSKSPRYTLKVTEDTELEALYSYKLKEVSSGATVNADYIREVIDEQHDRLRLHALYAVDSRNYAIKEAGFVLLQIDGAEYSGELTNSTEGAIVRGYNIDAYNYNLVKTFSVPNTSYWVVRPYYIVYDKATGEALAAQYGEQEIFDLLTDAD